MTDTLDWPRIADDLNAQGWAVVGPLLTPATCEALQALYDQPERFRSRIVMQRHGVSRVRAGRRMTLGLIFHDAA